MKLWEIFRFEFAYQVRRVWPWLIFAALIVFAFLMTRDGSLAEALLDDFFVNSPFAVAKTTVMGSLIWLLMAAVVAGEAAARDVATGLHPLVYTVPVGKAAYLGGRFLAALVLNALLLLAVQAGILLAVYAPGVEAEVIGPFRPAAYLTAYSFLALPNAFVATAIQFSLAVRSGRPMASYLGSVILFFMSYVVGLFLLFQGRQDVANLLDPIGVHFILSELSFLWTTVEKSWRLIELEGTVLTNRLLWLGIALGALAITYLGFRYAHRTERTLFDLLRSLRAGWRRRRTRHQDTHDPLPAGIGVTPRTPSFVPQLRRTFGFAFHARQTLAIAWTSFQTLATSWAGLALLAVIPLLTVLVVIDQMELNGVPLVPTTARVLSELTAPLSAELSRWVIIPLLIVFFAGELVWRERDAGLGEITAALPGSDWPPFLGKFLGLGLVLVVFLALLTAAGMLAQVILGYQDLEIGLYLIILFGLQLPEYLLFALLALVVHVLVDQKYIGHLAAIIVYVFIALASLLGIEHNLLIYGAGPGWSYSEMSGFGPSLGPWLWFKLYWAAWALLLAVAARLLWVRGRERGIGVRLQWARRRFTRATAWTAAAAVGLLLTLGGFIFYNTNVLNQYLTSSDIAKLNAEYEQRYKQYETIPQPSMTATNLHVEIYPARREVQIRGAYSLLNSSNVAIDSIHVSTVPGVEPKALAFDRTAALVVADEERGYRIYALETPLQPSDSLRLDFEVHIQPRGFRESGVDTSIVANGTYFTNGTWFPTIGYQQSRELISARERREHGLPERPVVPSLYDVEARMKAAKPIEFDAVVGTDANQVAVAPGRLHQTWMEDGRRYFHYTTDGPVSTELGYAFFSANYAVHKAKWNDITIQVFHHPGHTAHLDRMLRSIRASLDYYTEHFGPYPRSYLSVVERPGNGTGMHADAGMITHEEGFAFWSPKEDGESLDLPFAVVAHEMAHQWTLPYAPVEGAPVMSESLAWYYGMKVVEESDGPAQLRRLLRFMRQPYPYPPIRRGEPLLRGLDPYMSYRRGPFALHALSEYIGEEQVNTALRRLVDKHGSGVPPLPTTLDLYRELQAVTPDSLQYLLHDLFEVNTFWELEMERATAAQSEAGSWQVTLDVRARKVVVDEAGIETEVPMDELVEIGVFAPGQASDEVGEPLYVQMHRIHSGAQTITVTVPGKPLLAGIDPYHLLDWEERDNDDNIDAVEMVAR
jgi:ABC-2 type transport system permease protein